MYVYLFLKNLDNTVDKKIIPYIFVLSKYKNTKIISTKKTCIKSRGWVPAPLQLAKTRADKCNIKDKLNMEFAAVFTLKYFK